MLQALPLMRRSATRRVFDLYFNLQLTDSLSQGLYERTKHLLQHGVVSAKSAAVLRECWGKMFGDDGQWSRAKAEFYQAFTLYESCGTVSKAKDCLK